MPGLRRSAVLVFAVAVAAFALDQSTKTWVEHTLAGRPPVRVIPGVLSLTFTTNSGGAFGLGQSTPWVFVGATLVVSAVIVVIAIRPLRTSVAVALGLILGGALGNLADRGLNGPGFRGRVTDFIDLQIWPVFNLADTAIVIGALLLAWASFERPGDEAEASSGPGGASDPRGVST